jgi:cell surface protein SprA
MKISRWIVSILLLCLALGRVGAQEEPAADLIELSLGYGFGAPWDSGFWLDTGSGGITQGVLTDELIKRVFIQRELAERIFLDLDYDSDRQGGFFDGDNVYSLQYRGLENEFLQEISAGNRHLSIPDTRLMPIDEGNASSYALRTRMGTDRFRIQGLVRYSQALSGNKRFRGNSQLVEAELLDVSYVNRRFFFLPDNQIHEDSLQLLRSSAAAADGKIDDSNFAVLVRGKDFRFDNSTGWIYLKQGLGLISMTPIFQITSEQSTSKQAAANPASIFTSRISTAIGRSRAPTTFRKCTAACIRRMYR